MMRRQLFFCTAIAALLSTPAQAQYVDRYKSSERPQVEVNLDVLNDRQEQEYHAQTDVVQETLPVSQPPAMPAQTVEAMPELQPVAMQEVVTPAQKRKLLKPMLTAPAAEEDVVSEFEAPAAAQPPAVASARVPATPPTPDGEMPMPPPVVKHSVIRSYSPVDDMLNMPSDAELYREADMQEMAGAISQVEKPLPLPRRKPEMGEKKSEPVKMAAMTAKVYKPPHSVVDDIPVVAAAPAPEKTPEPKIEVAATEIAPDVKLEIKAEEKVEAAPITAEAPAEKEPAAETAAVEPAVAATPEPTPEPVRMAAADIPAPVMSETVEAAPVAAPTPAPARARIISQPPRLKEQRLVPLEPRSTTANKPIVSTPPSVGTPVAPSHVQSPVAPVVPVPPKMTAQPVAPVIAAPLTEIENPLPEAVPVVPVEQAAPAPEVMPAAPRPSLEIIAAPMIDPNQPSEAVDAMPVVPVIDDLTLGFPGNSSDLTGESQKKLDAVIRQMADMIEGRLQVRGYASGEDGSQSSARRIALSRALAVRSYLMDKGIKPTRVDVKTAGSDSDRHPLDRVDLIFAR